MYQFSSVASRIQSRHPHTRSCVSSSKNWAASAFFLTFIRYVAGSSPAQTSSAPRLLYFLPREDGVSRQPFISCKGGSGIGFPLVSQMQLMPTINPFWATWHTWLDLSLQVSEAIKVSERLFWEEPLLLSHLRFLGETYMVNECWTGPGTQGITRCLSPYQ